jgi:hypothetical protein
VAKQYEIKNEVIIGNVLGNTLRTWGTLWELDGNTLRTDPKRKKSLEVPY